MPRLGNSFFAACQKYFRVAEKIRTRTGET